MEVDVKSVDLMSYLMSYLSEELGKVVKLCLKEVTSI